MALSRLTDPIAFRDVASKQMLLPPVQEFTFARAYFGAYTRGQLALANELLGVTPSRAALQGIAPNQTLSDAQLLMANPLGSEIFVFDWSLFGKPNAVGSTIKFNRPVLTGGGYTAAARRINPAQQISLQPIDSDTEQVPITIIPQGGPYDVVNSRVAPRSLVEYPTGDEIMVATQLGLDMQYDRWALVDGVFVSMFCATATLIAYGNDPQSTITATTDVNAAFNTLGDRPMTFETLMRAEQALAQANVQPFTDGCYIAVLSPRQVLQLKTDADYLDQSKNNFEDKYNPISTAYLSRVSRTRIYQTNSVPTATNSTPVTYQKGAIFGPKFVGCAPGTDCMIRSASEDNYGLNPKFIWECNEGFGVLDNRRVVGIWTD